MNCCSCQHLFSSDLDFYYVAFSYIYAVEFFVYVCCKLSIIYIHVYADIGQNYLVNKAKMFYPSFYESVRQVMVFKWMLNCMIQVMKIFSPANLVHIIWCNITLNETLLHPMLTCTFHSPVRAVTSGALTVRAVTSELSPTGLWHQGSLWLWFVMPGIDDFLY